MSSKIKHLSLMVSYITKLTILDIFLNNVCWKYAQSKLLKIKERRKAAHITTVQSSKHSCTLQLTTHSPRNFSGPTCDWNASSAVPKRHGAEACKNSWPLKKEGTPWSLSPDFYTAWNRDCQRDGSPSSWKAHTSKVNTALLSKAMLQGRLCCSQCHAVC